MKMKLLLSILSLSMLLHLSACASSEGATKDTELELRQVPVGEAIEFYAKEKGVEIRYDKNDTNDKLVENLGFISFFTWQDGLKYILAPHDLDLIKDDKIDNLYHVKAKVISK